MDPRDEDFNWLRALGEIQDRAKYAAEALKDEHEGNFKHHVRELTGLANRLNYETQSM